MKISPLVTVIIPTYNYGYYICEAIDSVLASEFPRGEIEIIVIDDGSTDDTAERISVYGKQVDYYAQPNVGKAAATKIGIELAHGKNIFNLDADDLFLPAKIREVVSIFEEEASCVHVAHPAICWDVLQEARIVEPIPPPLLGRLNSGKQLLEYFYKRRMLFGGGSTFAARADVLKKVPIASEIDMFVDEYLVLAALNKGDSYFIREPLSIWRIHGENFSNAEVGRGDLAKTERTRKSMEAVFSSISNNDYGSLIKSIYGLKLELLQVTAREQAERKNINDVLNLWSYLWHSSGILGMDTVRVIASYGVLRRSLPVFALKFLKTARQSISKRALPLT
jgi:glycosyltransferase involved in cell wall biosynthesis